MVTSLSSVSSVSFIDTLPVDKHALHDIRFRFNYARQWLKMPRQLVNREEQGKLIAQTNGAITMINESNYTVRSKSGYNNYNVFVTHSGWACSYPNYLCRDLKCKHVYAVEFYRRQSASIQLTMNYASTVIITIFIPLDYLSCNKIAITIIFDCIQCIALSIEFILWVIC